MTVNYHVRGAERSPKPQQHPLLSQVPGGAGAAPVGCGGSLHAVLAPQCCTGLGWLPMSHRVKVTILTVCPVSPVVPVVGMVAVISSIFVQHREVVLPALTRVHGGMASAQMCCAGASLGVQDKAWEQLG